MSAALPIHEQAMALLNMSKLVSLIDLAKRLGVQPGGLASVLKRQVEKGHLVRKVMPSPTGIKRNVAFYRLPTTKEKEVRDAGIVPEPMLIVWNDPFAMGGRA